MSFRASRAASLGLFWLAFPLASVAQDVPTSAQSDADQASAVPQSRLIAGIREYPAAVVRALLAFQNEPLVLRQLADDPALMEDPAKVTPAISAELQAAARHLRGAPAIIAVAAGHPLELGALGALYRVAPDGAEERLRQLREDYAAGELAGAAAWERILRDDPVALGAYREALTRFCKEQLEAYDDFPYVNVTDRNYYYACVPNEAILDFVNDEAGDTHLLGVLDAWWRQHGTEAIDARVLAPARSAPERPAVDDALFAQPAERRRPMWRPAGADGGVGMVPVIMQPPADQPAEARYAFAVAEHARLWSPPVSDAPGPGEYVADLAEPDHGAPGVVVAELPYDDAPVVYIEDDDNDVIVVERAYRDFDRRYYDEQHYYDTTYASFGLLHSAVYPYYCGYRRRVYVNYAGSPYSYAGSPISYAFPHRCHGDCRCRSRGWSFGIAFGGASHRGGIGVGIGGVSRYYPPRSGHVGVRSRSGSIVTRGAAPRTSVGRGAIVGRGSRQGTVTGSRRAVTPRSTLRSTPAGRAVSPTRPGTSRFDGFRSARPGRPVSPSRSGAVSPATPSRRVAPRSSTSRTPVQRSLSSSSRASRGVTGRSPSPVATPSRRMSSSTRSSRPTRVSPSTVRRSPQSVGSTRRVSPRSRTVQRRPSSSLRSRSNSASRVSPSRQSPSSLRSGRGRAAPSRSSGVRRSTSPRRSSASRSSQSRSYRKRP